MIRTQLELFPKKIKKGQRTKKIIIRKSSSNYFKDWNESLAFMARNFNPGDRKYYGGMIDGDGSFNTYLPTKRKGIKLMVGLELRHDHAEPLLKLAELFDLTISKKVYLIPKGNTQPSLSVEFSGIKAKLFLFSIYPYLLEKKEKATKVLLQMGCPEQYLLKERQFSFEYLAGYTDSEGTVCFSLQHHVRPQRPTYSSYHMYYQLTSNDGGHLQFIKKSLIDLGFNHFRKDQKRTYEHVKKREGVDYNTNPQTWKPTSGPRLGGTPAQLSKFYEQLEPFILIKHKKENMLHTMKYNHIINIR
mgnify:FL=1